MASHALLPFSSKDESNSLSPRPFPSSSPSPSPRPHLRPAPVVVSSSSSCCFRRLRRPPPTPPRPKLSASADVEDLSRARETPAYLWRKDEKWHPVSYDGFSAAAVAAAAAPPPRRRRRTPKRKPPRRNPKPPSRMFSSDEEDDPEDGGEEEEEEEEEDEMLVSSTADNSFEMTELRIRRAAVIEGAKSGSSRATSPWRRLSPCLVGEGGESMAVVKQSEDPRSDFRRSMAEMVVEKGIYEARDLEQLLHCFLSLNSPIHHQAIVDAFADVWVALFPATPFGGSPGQGSLPLLPIGKDGE